MKRVKVKEENIKKTINNEDKKKIVEEYAQDLNDCKSEKEEKDFFDEIERKKKLENRRNFFERIFDFFFGRIKAKIENKRGMKELGEIPFFQDKESHACPSCKKKNEEKISVKNENKTVNKKSNRKIEKEVKKVEKKPRAKKVKKND